MTEDICPECNRPYNSEYHQGDACVNYDENIKGIRRVMVAPSTEEA